MPPLRFYIDATICLDTARTTVVFGPYFDRAEAERGLTAFIARENALGAVIRNPESEEER